MNNIQTFSSGSDQYARHRPQYPPELFGYLNEICDGHDRAWDCATGNGQAAVSCAQYFSQVEATDVSAEQIQNHISHPKVHYSVSPAEHTLFNDHEFDLVTVASAVHWFNQEKFFQEVERVLKPNGVLAVWGYSFAEIEPEIDDLIAKVLLGPIDRFWAEGNRQVIAGYRDLVLPFDEVRSPPRFAVRIEWTLEQLSAYLRTWSAVKLYAAELGIDPVDQLESELKSIWHDPDETKLVQMPLFFRAGRKPA
jgi:ubiquinone/menaquinone biosynthesis C-methylase UbiE